jgi:molecular chaperone GrpE
MSDKKENTKSEKKVEELQKKVEEYLAGWQRAKADYENLEKQAIKEKAELIKNAGTEMVISLLPILDNFSKAFEHKPGLGSCSDEEKKNLTQWFEGVDNIYRQFADVFRGMGVEKIEVIGKEFDPATMEAVDQKINQDKKDGIVLEEVLAGYRLNDQVIRPARVIVNNIKTRN